MKEFNCHELCNTDDLLKEAEILNSCNHINIVKLYGVCYENSQLKYLIMEYMNMGDLHSYLTENRLNNKNKMLEQLLINIIKQISNGCLYLENNKIIHRDLAAPLTPFSGTCGQFYQHFICAFVPIFFCQ